MIPSLPQELIDTVSVAMREDLVKVSVREFRPKSLEMIEEGRLAVLSPEGSPTSKLLNSPSDWKKIIGELESEIRRPF